MKITRHMLVSITFIVSVFSYSMNVLSAEDFNYPGHVCSMYRSHQNYRPIHTVAGLTNPHPTKMTVACPVNIKQRNFGFRQNRIYHGRFSILFNQQAVGKNNLSSCWLQFATGGTTTLIQVRTAPAGIGLRRANFTPPSNFITMNLACTIPGVENGRRSSLVNYRALQR